MRARPAGEILPLRVLLAPVRAETALLICSSRDERRFRSYSSCLSAEVRLVMEADGTRCNYPRYRSATRTPSSKHRRGLFSKKGRRPLAALPLLSLASRYTCLALMRPCHEPWHRG